MGGSPIPLGPEIQVRLREQRWGGGEREQPERKLGGCTFEGQRGTGEAGWGRVKEAQRRGWREFCRMGRLWVPDSGEPWKGLKQGNHLVDLCYGKVNNGLGTVGARSKGAGRTAGGLDGPSVQVQLWMRVVEQAGGPSACVASCKTQTASCPSFPRICISAPLLASGNCPHCGPLGQEKGFLGQQPWLTGAERRGNPASAPGSAQAWVGQGSLTPSCVAGGRTLPLF